VVIHAESWNKDTDPRAADAIWNLVHAEASRDEEFWARSTDAAKGRNAIYLKVDPNWYRDYEGPIHLLVTYRDTGAATWFAEWDAAGGRQQGPVVKVGESGALKTVTFELPSLNAAGGFPGGMDFRLLRTDGGDLVVQFVRLVKWPAGG
jgi:hypothetical protein